VAEIKHVSQKRAEGRWENNMAVKTTYCLRETRLKAVVNIL